MGKGTQSRPAKVEGLFFSVFGINTYYNYIYEKEEDDDGVETRKMGEQSCPSIRTK